MSVSLKLISLTFVDASRVNEGGLIPSSDTTILYSTGVDDYHEMHRADAERIQLIG